MSKFIFLYLLIFLLSFSLYLLKFRTFERRIKPILKWANTEGYRIPRQPNILLCYLVEGKFHWLYFPLGLLIFLFIRSKKILNYFYEIDELKKKRDSKKKKSTEKVLKSSKEYFDRAVLRISKYETKAAISDLSKCIELDPKEAKYYRFRGLAKKELGEIKRGCEDFLLASGLGDKEADSLIEKHSKIIGEIYRFRGIARKQVNDLEGAIKEWKLSVKYGDNESKDLLNKYQASNDAKEKNLKNQKVNLIYGERIIYLKGEITDQLANSIAAKLLEMDSKDNTKPIVIFIKSLGGSVTSGIAIYDVMQDIKSEVHTICTGKTSGMGTFILCAGTKGFRFSYRNTRISLCELSTKAEIPEDQSDTFEKINNFIYLKLSQLTGQAVERIKDDSNYWSKNGNYELSPEDAINYGIIDKIFNNN